MTKRISYASLTLIEAYLDEATKQLDREIFMANKDNNTSKFLALANDRSELDFALNELRMYQEYVANYSTL